jgi:DNA-binding LytR/AlgR family response regulator
MQEEITVLIIEDEELWARSLKANLDEFGFTIAGTANTFEAAVFALNQKNYDIVLLDIHLNGRESGIELGRMVHAFYERPFIFITASFDADIAKAAITAQPSAYLTKPVHPASLFTAIQTAIRNYTEKRVAVSPKEGAKEDSFFVKQGDKYKKVFWKDVVSLSSEKNYTGILNAADGSTSFIRSTLPKTLKYLVPLSLQENFVQLNRSEVIQLSFIQELAKDEVITAYKTYTVSESHLKDLKERLRIFS